MVRREEGTRHLAIATVCMPGAQAVHGRALGGAPHTRERAAGPYGTSFIRSWPERPPRLTQARTPVLTRRARAAGPVPPCALFFWLDFGVATLDFVAPCRFAAPDGVRALLSLDLVRRTRVGVALGEAARRRGVNAEA